MKQHSDIKNEDAGQRQTQPAPSENKKRYKTINSSDGAIHKVTHPVCYSCGSYMLLLADGKLCPSCGRLAVASEWWIENHPKYSGVV